MADKNLENNNVDEEVQELSMDDLEGVAGGMWVDYEHGMLYINGESEKFWNEWLHRYYMDNGLQEMLNYMTSMGFITMDDAMPLIKQFKGKSDSEKEKILLNAFRERAIKTYNNQ